jgi:hypothetical protein
MSVSQSRSLSLPVVGNPADPTRVAIGPDTLIPELLQAAPETRVVLDRYGLHGCGGRLGPVETLGFFARAHDVPLGELVAELRGAASGEVLSAVEAPAEARADVIYRRFFKAGIAIVLTLGAAWGAYLLARIALLGSFSAVELHEVNAHGHAQIFGWVGLFVVGFAYQAFPRFKHTRLAHPWLAVASWWLMLAGILARSLCEPLAALAPAAGVVAVGGSILEIGAVVLFAWVVLRTWHASGKRLAVYDYYIMSAIAWFVAQAVYETAYLTATLATSDTDALVALVARYQGPLREMQIHGFALLMILGVSQRMLHPMFGFRAPSPGLVRVGFWLLNVAVLGEVGGLLFLRTGRAWVAIWYGSVLLLAATCLILTWDFGVFGRVSASERSHKFLRAAYAWLLISLAMLVFMPLYQHALLPSWAPASVAAQRGFSHAYYGAVRHAITVGFISLMIMGVAGKIVPTLNGIDPARLPGLWLPFVLVNLGCAVRVAGQTLTDVSSTVFVPTGVSGILEVTGLALWGVHLWRVMIGRYVDEPAAGGTILAGLPVEPHYTVGAVLDTYPELLPIFLNFGFQPLSNPLLRRTLAPRVTIARASGLLGVNLTSLVNALNDGRSNAGRRTLPMVPA